jgi:hypothetical protein
LDKMEQADGENKDKDNLDNRRNLASKNGTQ